MRLGMFMMPVHPPGRSMSETLAEDTAKSLLADKLVLGHIVSFGDCLAAAKLECE